MTKIAVPAGSSLAQANERLNGRGFWLPRLLSDGAVDASSSRAAITFVGDAVTPNTVGSWVEIVSALTADVGYVSILLTANTFQSGFDTSALFNLGVGAGGSEVTVLPSLGVGWASTARPGWMFPLSIPKGSRVAGQVQGVQTSKSVSARFEFFTPTMGLVPSNKVAALGAVTASSKGTTLATPGGANAEGAWTQIIAATAEPYSALGIAIQGAADTSQANMDALLDIAVGSAGNEVPIISNLGVATNTTETVSPQSALVHPVNIPAGSRLAARYQGSAITSGLDVILYGIRYAR